MVFSQLTLWSNTLKFVNCHTPLHIFAGYNGPKLNRSPDGAENSEYSLLNMIAWFYCNSRSHPSDQDSLSNHKSIPTVWELASTATV